MTQFILTGGTQRQKLLGGIPEWAMYEKAVCAVLDTESGALKQTLAYESPTGVRPEPGCHIFKSGSVHASHLWVVTQTEVLKIGLPSFDIDAVYSLYSYNDLHHVCFIDGDMHVVSTGLDCVVQHDGIGEPKKWHHALGKDIVSCFDLNKDWRQAATTKPHASHPNFCFNTAHGLWMTRFKQKDAVCVAEPDRRIPIDVGNPHDGLVHDTSVWFTTTNGHLVQSDPETCVVEHVYDMNQASKDGAPLGWCRGLHIEGRIAYVGFSRIRKTKIHKNLAWIKHGFRLPEGYQHRETRVAAYDLDSRQFIREWDVEPAGLSTIFSILPWS